MAVKKREGEHAEFAVQHPDYIRQPWANEKPTHDEQPSIREAEHANL
jgi:hypothetical protein